MQRFLSFALFAALLGAFGAASGCGSSSAPAADADAGPSATPAAGGGVCCPLTASAGCSPSGYLGGWQPDASGCLAESDFDGPPFVHSTDSHGCAVLVEDRSAIACGTRPPENSGADAADDAPFDPPTDAPTDGG